MGSHKKTWNLRNDWIVVVAWNVINVVHVATVNLKMMIIEKTFLVQTMTLSEFINSLHNSLFLFIFEVGI